jgi:hypothetical protein
MNDIDNEKHTADYMGMSRSWLRCSRVKGDGPRFYKVGRSIRYRKVDIDTFLTERQATNTIYRRL